MTGWPPKSIAQVVGWTLIMLGAVLVFGGVVGAGGGAAHDPGADTLRALILDRNMGRFAVGMVGVGLLALFASLFMRDSDQ